MTRKVSKKDITEMAMGIKLLGSWLDMLRPIKSEADLNEAVENLASFMDLDAEEGSREGNMLETLAILIVDYEKAPRTRPKGDDAAEIEALLVAVQPFLPLDGGATKHTYTAPLGPLS